MWHSASGAGCYMHVVPEKDVLVAVRFEKLTVEMQPLWCSQGSISSIVLPLAPASISPDATAVAMA